MARPSWLGIGPVTRSAQEAQARNARGEKVGLVLSGGGSKASFQLGALRYLYEVVGIAPQVLVGTSAGSILTAMLAQSADPGGQAEAVRRLEELWLGMERQSDMFAERSWFRRFRARGPELMALVMGSTSLGGEQGRAASGRSLPRLQLPFTRGFGIGADDQQQDEPDDQPDSPAEAAEQVLAPQLETLALATRDPRPTPGELTLTQVMSVLAGLTRMRGVGTDLGVIINGAEKTRSMYIPGPILRELLGSGMFTSSRVADSGVTVRIAMVALESGELHFMREDGHLVDRDDRPIGGSQHDFSRGVLASCSIPMVFTPVRLDDQTYIDGGVRENVPAEMAIGVLGCTTTWVVTSNAPSVKPSESYQDKDMFSVMLRATEIGSDEIERDEIAYARSAGALVIEPELDVHDSLTVDPGLVRINRDYGWMRAAEQHLAVDASQQALVRSIIAARRRIWELECAQLDASVPHDERELLLLARLKYDLREQVPRLVDGLAPAGAERWWQDWEAHSPRAEAHPPWMV